MVPLFYPSSEMVGDFCLSEVHLSPDHKKFSFAYVSVRAKQVMWIISDHPEFLHLLVRNNKFPDTGSEKLSTSYPQNKFSKCGKNM